MKYGVVSNLATIYQFLCDKLLIFFFQFFMMYIWHVFYNVITVFLNFKIFEVQKIRSVIGGGGTARKISIMKGAATPGRVRLNLRRNYF